VGDVDVAPAFGVLGVLEVRRDGVPVPVPGGRRRAVLAALLVRAGQPVSADALVEAAWGDELPADPRSALQTVLSRLRRVLGGGVVRAGPAGYMIDPGPGGVDAGRFEALRAQAAGAPATQAAGLLDEALALWRGPAYTEFADCDFARPEAVRLDELRLATMEDRAELSLELGAAAGAAVTLDGLVAAHPLRERARGLLMTALYRAGRTTEALDRYHDYRTLLASELGLDPSPALQDLQVRILGHNLAAPPPPARRPVAAAPAWLVMPTAFLGREDDTAALLDAVGAHRLVTVTGPGGVGKTRLVAEALTGLSERFGLPVTVTELAGTRAGEAGGAVAAALGLGPAPSVRAAVLEYLSISAVLLVLDNCEHVLGDVRVLAEEILRRCPRVRVVATSRRRLGLAAEQVLPLAPLPVPGPGAGQGAALTAAVRLFADRMRRVRPSFALTPDVLPAVADICRRLDGLPLAVELAATRAATLGPGPLRDRLADSLDLLGEEGRPRHDTLRAVVDWSYALLGPAERRLLAVLSVFGSDFDLEAAEQVAGPGAVGSVALSLAGLVDSSLVAAHDTGNGTAYRLLMIIRAFAAERLADAGQEQMARLAHARWVASLTGTAARQATGPGCDAALARVHGSQADVRAAVRWALDSGRPGLAGRITGALKLCPHWRPDTDLIDLISRVARAPGIQESPAAALALAAGGLAACDTGELAQAERLGSQAWQRAADPAERFLALLCLGIATLYRGDHDRSAMWWEQVAASTDFPPAHRAEGHASLALLACYHGDPAAAREHAQRARVAAEAAGASGYQAFATYAAGEAALLDNPQTGIALLRAAAAQADRAGATQVVTVARIALVSALTRLGRHGEALALFRPLLDQARREGNWPQLWTALRILAELLASLDRHETAAVLLTAARQSPSAPAISGPDADRYRALDDLIRQRVDAAVLDQIATLASALPRTQVVDRALAAIDALQAQMAPR
jgi:predicted ATPase/DNA-binding SARP family transcriptional activator/tetratricopeptide (TPR) repeat protein